MYCRFQVDASPSYASPPRSLPIRKGGVGGGGGGRRRGQIGKRRSSRRCWVEDRADRVGD
eukprot:8446319-Pyramimonas_sp.AAC.1